MKEEEHKNKTFSWKLFPLFDSFTRKIQVTDTLGKNEKSYISWQVFPPFLILLLKISFSSKNLKVSTIQESFCNETHTWLRFYNFANVQRIIMSLSIPIIWKKYGTVLYMISNGFSLKITATVPLNANMINWMQRKLKQGECFLIYWFLT